MSQTICRGVGPLKEIWESLGARRVLLVCGASFDRLSVRGAVLPPDAEVVRFSGFHPNPCREDVEDGVVLFRRERCDAILAVGGGSAIDVAKCIKLFSGSGVPLVAMPTTAGTGSESTCHAVVYENGVKQSVSDPSILPQVAVLEPSVLRGLPPYQKKCTMLDALCQGVESWWSINATEESESLARAAVEGIAAHWRTYIDSDGASGASEIMEAANLSGQAISITATTAPHAMSYKLTSLYGLPHGHAVALCMREVWPYLAAYADEHADSPETARLRGVLAALEKVLPFADFRAMLDTLGMERPRAENREAELSLLAASVNPERLKNSPVALGQETLRAMYERILR